MRIASLLGVALLAAAALLAQGQFGQLANPALDVRSVVWNPQVGQGSEYDLDSHNGSKMHISFIITGTETVNGQLGHWLETGMNFEELGQVYSEMLMTQNAGKLQTNKWVVQLANRPPMEMPERRMLPSRSNSNAQTETNSNFRNTATRVAVESITVPAGTFQCEHWRANDGSGDAWLSSNVVPYSLVKGVDKDGGTAVLTRTLNNAKSHVTGKPVPFDPSIFAGLGRRR
jgi:hypothetical protein